MLSAWVPKPEDLTFEETAGYASVVESSLRVIEQVGVQPGETLLVSGASGGVGSVVLQVARERGISVIGVAGANNRDYLRSLGALATTYGDGWVERVRWFGRVDAVLDVAGSGVVPELVKLTGNPDRVISIADLSAPEHGARFSGAAGSVQDALDEVVDLIATGRLRTPVEKTYTLAEAAQAQIDSKAGHTRGRRVIVVWLKRAGLRPSGPLEASGDARAATESHSPVPVPPVSVNPTGKPSAQDLAAGGVKPSTPGLGHGERLRRTQDTPEPPPHPARSSW